MCECEDESTGSHEKCLKDKLCQTKNIWICSDREIKISLNAKTETCRYDQYFCDIIFTLGQT